RSAPQVPCQYPASIRRSPAVFDASSRMLRCGNYIDSARFSFAKTTARRVLPTVEVSYEPSVARHSRDSRVGSAPDLAVQPGLGLLPERRARVAAADPHRRSVGAWAGEPMTTSRAA